MKQVTYGKLLLLLPCLAGCAVVSTPVPVKTGSLAPFVETSFYQARAADTRDPHDQKGTTGTWVRVKNVSDAPILLVRGRVFARDPSRSVCVGTEVPAFSDPSQIPPPVVMSEEEFNKRINKDTKFLAGRYMTYSPEGVILTVPNVKTETACHQEQGSFVSSPFVIFDKLEPSSAGSARQIDELASAAEKFVVIDGIDFGQGKVVKPTAAENEALSELKAGKNYIRNLLDDGAILPWGTHYTEAYDSAYDDLVAKYVSFEILGTSKAKGSTGSFIKFKENFCRTNLIWPIISLKNISGRPINIYSGTLGVEDTTGGFYLTTRNVGMNKELQPGETRRIPASYSCESSQEALESRGAGFIDEYAFWNAARLKRGFLHNAKIVFEDGTTIAPPKEERIGW